MLRHNVEVHTNDPKSPVVQLSIMGNVTEFARISNRYVRLSGKAGEALTAQVEIVPVQPFKIVEVSTQPGEHIKVRWETTSKGNPPSYRLVIENSAKTAAKYLEKITIKTDSELHPVFVITVQGLIE
jgi:hypothetical protein